MVPTTAINLRWLHRTHAKDKFFGEKSFKTSYIRTHYHCLSGLYYPLRVIGINTHIQDIVLFFFFLASDLSIRP